MAKIPLLFTSRCYDDFEQSPLEPIASVAGISSQKKWLTGFEVMLRRGAEQSRGQGLGQKCSVHLIRSAGKY
jgi:hypothetical protein